MAENENTEQQAINELIELLGDTPTEQQTQLTAPTPPSEPTQQTEQTAPQSPNADVISAIQQLGDRLAPPQEQTEQTEPTEPTPQEIALNELGLKDVAEQLKTQQNFIDEAKKQAELKAEGERREKVFKTNIKQFEADFKDISIDELAKYVADNKLEDYIDEDYKGWELIGQAMQNLAKNKAEADPIIGSSGSATNQSAFARLEKGENVDDTELGAEILGLSK